MKIGRTIRWGIENIGTVVLAILATGFQNKYAENILMFWTGFVFLMCLCCLPDKIKEALNKRGPAVPVGWTMGCDLLVALILAAVGWFWMAAVWMFSAAMVAYVHDIKEEEA